MDTKELRRRQSLPLDKKIELSIEKITTWYEYWEGKVYVAFSGGKDSTVLLDVVRSKYPEVPGVFVDTGLEYPEIKEFVKTFDNIITVKPKMPFKKVIEKYGYPVISKATASALDRFRNAKTQKHKEYRLMGDFKNGKKRTTRTIPKKWKYLINAPFKISERCCNYMKKEPMHRIEKELGAYPFIGIMASDSNARRKFYVEHGGCNIIDLSHPMSIPLSFWTEQDIWLYLNKKHVPYCKIYDMGEKRTGCMFCMFGVHLENEPNRFQRMAISHPKHYKFCMEKLGLREVLSYMNIPYKPFTQNKLEEF